MSNVDRSFWQGKLVIITGASAGLGLALTKACNGCGAQVVMLARDRQRLEAARGTLPHVDRSLAVVCDVTDDTSVTQAIGEATATLQGVDVLINAAGVSARKAIASTTPVDFQQLIDVNLLGAVRATRACMEILLSRRGHVVNIGSLASKLAAPYLGAYPASKFALAAYTQQLRLELGPKGLHALLVCPGPIRRPDAGGRYDDQTSGLPDSARRPGGGVRVRGIDPHELAVRILDACRRRSPELVVPAKARYLAAVAQLSPRLGDWLIRRLTG